MNNHPSPINDNQIFETCIMCGKLTDVLVNTHIDFRHGYVEGCGQCCRECYNNTNEDYITKVMKRRTTLVTISAEEILDTPNNSILGLKVREMLWSLFDKQK